MPGERPAGRVVRTADLPPVGHPLPPPRPAGGPGTELKKILSGRLFRWFGVRQFPGCRCEALAREMDDRGPDWCAASLEYLVGQLRANHEALVADKREHGDDSFTAPFSDRAAAMVVGMAIRRARKVEIRPAKPAG